MAVPAAATRRHHVLGISIAFACVFIGAAQNVYTGYLVQGLHPILMLSVCITIGLVVFNAVQLFGDRRAYLEKLRANAPTVALLNLITIGSWVGATIALRFIEPALANSATIGVVPLATLGFSRVLRRGAPPLRSDVLAAIGMFIVAAVQAVIVASGSSALGKIPDGFVAAGIVCLLVNGVSNGAIAVLNKKLSEAGMKTGQVVASRFFIVVAACWIYVAVVQPPFQPLYDNFGGVVAVALIGTVGFIYLFQMAIGFTEPLTVTLIGALSPGAVLGLQWFDHRLQFSVFSLVSIAVLIALVMWSAVNRVRSAKK